MRGSSPPGLADGFEARRLRSAEAQHLYASRSDRSRHSFDPSCMMKLNLLACLHTCPQQAIVAMPQFMNRAGPEPMVRTVRTCYPSPTPATLMSPANGEPRT